MAATIKNASGVEIIDSASCDYCFNIVIIPPVSIENFGFVKKPSHTGVSMLKIQKKLAEKHRYQPLKPDLSSRYRNLYFVELPEICKQNMERYKGFLKTKRNTVFAEGWERIVIGDYGAFIEMSPEQISQETLVVESGQEYRINDPNYNKNCKYQWLTVSDGSQIKVYFQQKTVSYADYLPNMYYVSPYEIIF